MAAAEVVEAACSDLSLVAGFLEDVLHVARASCEVLQGHLEVPNAFVQVLVVELGIGKIWHDADSTLEGAQKTAVIP